MDKKQRTSKKANKLKSYHCLKIVESFINGDIKTTNKHIKKLVEKQLKLNIDKAFESEQLT